MDPCALALEVWQYHFCHIPLVYSGPTRSTVGGDGIGTWIPGGVIQERKLRHAPDTGLVALGFEPSLG